MSVVKKMAARGEVQSKAETGEKPQPGAWREEGTDLAGPAG